MSLHLHVVRHRHLQRRALCPLLYSSLLAARSFDKMVFTVQFSVVKIIIERLQVEYIMLRECMFKFCFERRYAPSI